MKDETKKWLEVSITGRYTYALIALEKALQIVGLNDDPGAKYIIKLLWVFPSTKNPDDWFDDYAIHIDHQSFYEEHISEFTTKSNLTPFNKDRDMVINALGIDVYNDFKHFYEKAPLFIMEIIFRIFEIATVDRYGSCGENSFYSFEELQFIIEKMLENHIPLPSTELFLRRNYPITIKVI